VVAFNVSGLPDFIDHERTGYLATAFETQDLASGIEHILASADVRESMSRSARQRAEDDWSYRSVGAAHAELFAQVIEKSRSR
jgi:glycosyltransferase involved in cell wall biosynthesis